MHGRNCAYCGSSDKLTEEHLLPDCISKRWTETVETNIATRESQKVVTSDPTIRDVCEHCNNVVLGGLDSYACELYDLYFAHLIRAGDRIKLKIDLDLLMRWILKTGYNVARARKWSTSLGETTPYIIGRELNRPPSRLFLQLVIPSKVRKGEIKDFPEATEVPPSYHRVAALDVRSSPSLKTAFLLTLSSYYFYVLVEDPGVPKRTRDKNCDLLRREWPGACEIKPKKEHIIYASSVDMLHAEAQSMARIQNVLNWNDWKRKGSR